MGKVSTLTYFQLRKGCEDYSFLDHAFDDFKQSLGSILTDGIDMPELDALFDDAGTMPSSVFTGFLCSFSNTSDNSRLPPSPSIKSCEVWCHLFLHVPQAVKMSAFQSWFITFPIIELFLDSGLICHLIISLLILPIRGLISVFLTFSLALVPLLMPLWTQSSLFLISDLLWLIQLPIFRVLILEFGSQRCVLYWQGLSSSVCQAVVGATWASTKFTNNAGRNGPCNMVKRVYQTMPICLRISWFFGSLKIPLAWHRFGIYHSAISAFLDPHCYHKASNHHIISKLMCQFIYNIVLLVNGLFHGISNVYYIH